MALNLLFFIERSIKTETQSRDNQREIEPSAKHQEQRQGKEKRRYDLFHQAYTSSRFSTHKFLTEDQARQNNKKPR